MDRVKTLNDKASKPVVWTIYVIIMFEMLYMSTPFALFFYSVYGTPLRFLGENSSTVWLIQNVLPHFTQTGSFLINALLTISWPLMGVGFLIFIIGFCQVYWAKFRRRGPVSGGLYRFIRHPQYAGWIIFGLGMAIFWSRMIVLMMYVSMLFIYYLLALREERECLEKYGESYRTYLERTGRFLPWSGKSEKRPVRKATLIFLYLMALGGTIGLGFIVKAYTLSEISMVYREDTAVVALAPMNREQMDTVLDIALSNQNVKKRLEALHGALKEKRLIYIIPQEWHVSELAMEEEPAHDRHHGYSPATHGNPTHFDRYLYKVLISRAIVDQGVEEKDILSRARGQKPRLVVRVDLKEKRVTGLTTPPEQGKYGDLPVPVF